MRNTTPSNFIGTESAVIFSELIKTKCHTAAIEIVLDNRGDRAYRPEMYGSKIIISRTFTESSSSLKLKSERGKDLVTSPSPNN